MPLYSKNALMGCANARLYLSGFVSYFCTLIKFDCPYVYTSHHDPCSEPFQVWNKEHRKRPLPVVTGGINSGYLAPGRRCIE